MKILHLFAAFVNAMGGTNLCRKQKLIELREEEYKLRLIVGNSQYTLDNIKKIAKIRINKYAYPLQNPNDINEYSNGQWYNT